MPLPNLPALSDDERSSLSEYLRLLADTIGDDLFEVVVFGSVARNETWPRGMRIRSDLDLLVITHSPLPEDVAAALVEATLPLFLRTGRQIAPQFRTRQQIERPRGETAARFLANVRRDGIPLYRRERIVRS